MKVKESGSLLLKLRIKDNFYKQIKHTIFYEKVGQIVKEFHFNKFATRGMVIMAIGGMNGNHDTKWYKNCHIVFIWNFCRKKVKDQTKK